MVIQISALKTRSYFIFLHINIVSYAFMSAGGPNIIVNGVMITLKFKKTLSIYIYIYELKILFFN